MAEQALIKVRINRAGVKSIGKYQAGKDYDVEREDAARLVAVKGFTSGSKSEDKKLAAEYAESLDQSKAEDEKANSETTDGGAE